MTHDSLLGLAGELDEVELRRQYHPDLSPAGWHVAHVAFVAEYWLREVVLGDDSRTRDGQRHFFPEHIDKAARATLPAIADPAHWRQAFNDIEGLWDELSHRPEPVHPLLQRDYLGWFLLQHAEQHRETLQMIRWQRALAAHPMTPDGYAQPDPVSPGLPAIGIPAGRYRVGSEAVVAYDNEQPRHQVGLADFRIAASPVSNAEYLGFMASGGYARREWWSSAGWAWRERAAAEAPQHWRLGGDGWYAVSPGGAATLAADTALQGICWYEAEAFARYAGCRLPGELEWEAAMLAHPALAATTGEAWEWCANAFYPYPGFRAFPYERYSTPWFDGRHHVLRGASRHTGETTRRPSFRNFYEADKRHVFAGLRLASSA